MDCSAYTNKLITINYQQFLLYLSFDEVLLEIRLSCCIPLLSRPIISYLMSTGKGFPSSKILSTDLGPLYLVGLNPTGNLNFSSEF